MASRRVVFALALAALVPVGAYAATAGRDDRVSGGCPVAGPGTGSAITGSFGSKRTVVVPPAEDDGVPVGTTQGRRQPDGSIYAKILWRRDPRRAGGRLTVTGRQLGGAGAALRARLDQGHRGFVPSALTFASPGCWRVTARAGDARARYVVRVVVQSAGS